MHAKLLSQRVSVSDCDYCDITHMLPCSGTEIHEITKSFSPPGTSHAWVSTFHDGNGDDKHRRGGRI
jgi:hypothetical protein